jgi:hypothetical protein
MRRHTFPRTFGHLLRFGLFAVVLVGHGACSGTARDDVLTVGSGGRYELGGSLAQGGKIVIPIGQGGGSTVGGAGTGAASASGGQEGSLATCDLPSGPSAGDPTKTLTLDDFEDGENGYESNGLRGGWYGYHDGTNGVQQPTAAEILPEPGGLSQAGFALHIRGEGFSEWGSGFTASLSNSGAGQCLFDASKYAGLTFWAKGEIGPDPTVTVPAYDAGKLLLLVIEKDIVPLAEGGNCPAADGGCWDSHRTRFELSDCWQRYSVRFEDLLQAGFGFSGGDLDLNELLNVNFEVGRGNRYDVWIDDLSFFVDPPEPVEPLCLGGQGGQSTAL